MPAALRFDPSLLLRAQGIKLLLLDVDGVMTDGGILIAETGETLKRFNTLDGLGLKLLMQAGITPAVITGRDSKPLRARLASLGIGHAYFGVDEKHGAAQKIHASLGLEWEQTAAMGDDWPDLALLTRAAFACAPANAHAEVLAVSHHVTQAQGGFGAVREVCDILLMANGHYATFMDHYAQ